MQHVGCEGGARGSDYLSDELIKPEAKRIIISAIVEVLPLNPFVHSIVSLDNDEKSLRYWQTALRTDHRLAGFIHC